MCRWHNEWYLSPGDLLVCCMNIIFLHANGRFNGTGHGRVLHHLPQLVDIVSTVIPIFRPNIQKIIESSVMLRILLPIVRRSVAQQLHNIRLAGAGQGRKSRRRIQVVLCMVEEVVEEVNDV